MSSRKGQGVMIRGGVMDAGRLGKTLGPAVVVGTMSWTPVLWDGDEDPDWFKTQCLTFEVKRPYRRRKLRG